MVSKYLLLAYCFLFPVLLRAQEDTVYRNYISRLVTTAAAFPTGKDHTFKRSVKGRNGRIIRREDWAYKALNDSVFYFQVRYNRSNQTDVSETYITLHEQLIYAAESETWYGAAVNGMKPEPQMSWSAHYYFKKGQMMDFFSNGHGKSEADDWNPEAYIPKWFKKRKLQLQQYRR